MDGEMSMAAEVIALFPEKSVDLKLSLAERMSQAGRLAVDKVAASLSETAMNMDLEELSNSLFARSREITGAMLSAYFDARASDPSERIAHPCPKCGERIPCYEARPRTIETRHGVISFDRPYYHCRACKLGFFPMDDDLRLAAKVKQHDLGRVAMKLLAELPYATAAELFKETTGLVFSNHCMHGLAEAMEEQTSIEMVLPSPTEVEALIEQASGNFRRPVVVISADGAHEPCRPESGSRAGERGAGYWREAKGFRIYLLTKKGIVQIASWHQIMNEEEFGKALDYASSLLPRDKIRIGLVADGAPWLWTHMNRAFPEGKEILDYFHLSEHVHKVAQFQYGTDTQEAKDWCESTIARLWLGEVGSVIWGLDRIKAVSPASQEEIRKFKGYLENNCERIDYDAANRGGFPLGSGGIESANKFICHIRIKRSGAWWYERNANAMLRIRCAKYNGTIDRILNHYKATAAKIRQPKRRSKAKSESFTKG